MDGAKKPNFQEDGPHQTKIFSHGIFPTLYGVLRTDDSANHGCKSARLADSWLVVDLPETGTTSSRHQWRTGVALLARDTGKPHVL